MFLLSCFSIFFMCDDLSFINTMQKTLKPSKKNVPMPRMDEKKLHTQEFQLKGSGGNMRCKLLQNMFTGKTTECSKHLHHIAIEKDILAELYRCIFQISLKYIKLVIPKILFISLYWYYAVLIFTSKLCDPPPPPKNVFWPTSIAKTFLKFLNPTPSSRRGRGRGACPALSFFLIFLTPLPLCNQPSTLSNAPGCYLCVELSSLQ